MAARIVLIWSERLGVLAGDSLSACNGMDDATQDAPAWVGEDGVSTTPSTGFGEPSQTAEADAP